MSSPTHCQTLVKEIKNEWVISTRRRPQQVIFFFFPLSRLVYLFWCVASCRSFYGQSHRSISDVSCGRQINERFFFFFFDFFARHLLCASRLPGSRIGPSLKSSSIVTGSYVYRDDDQFDCPRRGNNWTVHARILRFFSIFPCFIFLKINLQCLFLLLLLLLLLLFFGDLREVLHDGTRLSGPPL